MKTITFYTRNGSYDRPGGYGCSEPGNNSGEYVRADVARGLLEACEAFDLALCAGNRDKIIAAGVLARAAITNAVGAK